MQLILGPMQELPDTMRVQSGLLESIKLEGTLGCLSQACVLQGGESMQLRDCSRRGRLERLGVISHQQAKLSASLHGASPSLLSMLSKRYAVETVHNQLNAAQARRSSS